MSTAPAAKALQWLLFAAAAILIALAAARWSSPALLELHLLVFVSLAGITVGAIGFLMIGHLLGELWLVPVRDELEPLARAMPLVAILGAPLLLGLEVLYPWARGDAGLPADGTGYLEAPGFAIRSAVYVAVWSVTAALVARPGRHRGTSIIGLMLLLPTVSHASIDWVASREPQWISSLYGFSFAAAQALAALALATLITLLRQGHPPARRLRSLQSAILSLALLSLWIWFSQFLIVWMADLPQETGWYFGRWGGVWAILNNWVAVPALAAAIILFVPPRPGRLRIIACASLIMVQHVSHMIWLVRPFSYGSTIGAVGWLDVAVPLSMLALWWLFLAVEMVRQPEPEPEPAMAG